MRAMAKITVYRYKKWSPIKSCYLYSTRMGTLEAIRDIIDGYPIKGSAAEIDDSNLSRVLPGLTGKEFRLQKR